MATDYTLIDTNSMLPVPQQMIKCCFKDYENEGMTFEVMLKEEMMIVFVIKA